MTKKELIEENEELREGLEEIAMRIEALLGDESDADAGEDDNEEDSDPKD